MTITPPSEKNHNPTRVRVHVLSCKHVHDEAGFFQTLRSISLDELKNWETMHTRQHPIFYLLRNRCKVLSLCFYKTVSYLQSLPSITFQFGLFLPLYLFTPASLTLLLAKFFSISFFFSLPFSYSNKYYSIQQMHTNGFH